MYATLNEKVRAVYDYLHGALEVRSIADFAAKIGKNRSNVSEIMSGRGTVTEQLASAIVQRFPSINKQYLIHLDCDQMLITGAGDVLSNVTNVNFKSPSATINVSDKDMIDRLKAENDRLNEQIEWLRGLIDKLTVK